MIFYGNLFRPGQAPLMGAVVETRDDRIADVRQGPPSKQWIIPGLIDAHVHFFQSGGLYTRPDIIDLTSRKPYDQERREIQERLPDTFARYLRSGVTGVADCGGPFWNFKVREQAKTLNVAVSGPLISTYGPPALQCDDSPIIQCDTPEAARELVRRQLPFKPDFIKIWYILLNRKPEQLLPIVHATMEESHKAGIRVAVHATELETARAAVQAGADILVHSVFDREVDDAFIELLRQRKVVYITTLMVVERYRQTLSHTLKLTRPELEIANPYVTGTLFDRFENKERPPTPAGLKNLKRLHDAGVTVAAGTDAGNIGTPHGPAIFRELQLMVEGGLTPAQALACATANSARVLGRPDLGSVEVGKRADFVVLRSNPLDDVLNAADIDQVVKDGKPYKPEDLIRRSPADVVQHQLNAYNARDVDAFAATYADDIVVYREGKEVMSGKATLRDRYAKLFADHPNNHAALTGRRIDGNIVTDDEHVTGRATGEVRARARYTVIGGLISRVDFL